MKSLKNFALFCASCLVSLNTIMPAHSGIPEPACTLEQLIQMAMSRSEIISSKKEFIEEIRWAKRQAASWKNPFLSLAGGAKRAEGKIGPQYSISISQPFIFPGKTGLIEDVYSSDEKIAGYSLEETKLFIRYEVIRLFYSYSIALEIERHLHERVERFSLIENYMKSRPFASSKKRMERNIVQSRLLILQKNLSELQSEKDVLWSRLNLYAGFKERIRFDARWFVRGPELNRDEIITSAIDGNTELKKQRALLEKLKHEARLADKEVYPDFDLMTFYNQESAGLTERSFGAGITFNLPVINRNQGEINSIRARSKAEALRCEHQAKMVRHGLEALLIGYDTARRNLKRFPISLLKKTHSQLYDADGEFSKGTIELLTYLEAESQVYDTHAAVFNSQREFIEKYIAILMLSGSEDFKTGE
jgi:outer membrane protein, heavy metal efflux system